MIQIRHGYEVWMCETRKSIRSRQRSKAVVPQRMQQKAARAAAIARLNTTYEASEKNRRGACLQDVVLFAPKYTSCSNSLEEPYPVPGSRLAVPGWAFLPSFRKGAQTEGSHKRRLVKCRRSQRSNGAKRRLDWFRNRNRIVMPVWCVGDHKRQGITEGQEKR